VIVLKNHRIVTVIHNRLLIIVLQYSPAANGKFFVLINADVKLSATGVDFL